MPHRQSIRVTKQITNEMIISTIFKTVESSRDLQVVSSGQIDLWLKH